MIPQGEADALIRLPKMRKFDQYYVFPPPGETLTIPIISQDGRENFLVDVNRGRSQVRKCSYQLRYQQIIILIRLDIGGSPHGNPDVENIPYSDLAQYNGQTINCPHLHLYVEGFLDSWAIPAPNEIFPNTDDLLRTLSDFFRYCYIVIPPLIYWGPTWNEL